MKSLTGLWKAVADDYSAICGTPIDRDFKTVIDRVEDEGESFLTITLPSYAQDFERSLAQGRVGSDLFKSFKKRGGLPVFLSGFLLQIFDDSTTHEVRHHANVDAIRAVRGLCLLFKKVEIECTPERNAAVMQQFIDCEQDLQKVVERFDELPLREFRRVSSALFGDSFDALNREVENYELSPAHGSGSTADRKVGNQKFDQTEWTDRLEHGFFPYGRYVTTGWRHALRPDGDYVPDLLTPERERPARYTQVPKTQKGPRGISMEPTCMQYAQQALMKSLVPKLERSRISGPFTHFTNQEHNRAAARKSSKDGSLATLDLSEASDRVLNRLVEYLLAPWPSLSAAVQACRSTRVQFDDGKVMPIVKFASMGSALTFPMEAVVFTTLVFMGVFKAHGRDTRDLAETLAKYRGQVHVYGDDLIVPVESAHAVQDVLELFGLKINAHKSFVTGRFRESCGGDYYNGEDVKPPKLRRPLPESHRDTREVVSLNSFMNQCYAYGLDRAGDYAKDMLSRVLKTPLKYVPYGSQAIGIQADPALCVAEAMDPILQVPVLRAPVVVDTPREVSVGGFGALWKTLTGSWMLPEFRDHLEYSGRPVSSRMKNTWVPIR